MSEEEKKEEQKEEKQEEKQEEQKPETYEVKVDGEVRQMTLEELKANASKAAGADEKFRNAAQMKEDATRGIEIGKAFDKVNSENVTASDVRHLAELTGQDADELVRAFNNQGKDDKDDKKDDKKPPLQGPQKKLELKDFPEDVQEILNAAKDKQVEDAEIKIKKMVGDEVDKDDFLGKIVLDAPDEQREGVKEVVKSMVQRDVRAKILASPYTKEKFGAEMIRNSIQMVRAEVKRLGIPSKSSKKADRISLLNALGPTGGLPVEVYSDDKVERVESTDPNYEDNAVKRLGQMMRKESGRDGI